MSNNSLELDILNHLKKRFNVEAFNPVEIKLPKLKSIFSAYQKSFSSKKIITIAGTNGKGETAFSLAHYLKHNKKSYALWTSPHVLSITERFSSHLGQISHQKLLDYIHETQAEVKSKGEDFLSYYEFLFLVFCKYADNLDCEYIILEVGLGGRLDTTNIFDADVTALVSIGRDHTEFLGKTYKEIVMEKILISRKDKPLFTPINSKYLLKLIKEHQKEILFKLVLLPFVKNNYSLTNQNLAKEIAKYLLRDKFHEPSGAIKSKARFEQLSLGSIQFSFVGTHNLAGFRALVDTLHTRESRVDEIWLSFSKRELKEIIDILKMLRSSIKTKKNIMYCFEHDRAIGIEEIDQCKQYCSMVTKSWKDSKSYIRKQLQNDEPREVLVTGSYYFISEVQKFLETIDDNFSVM